MSRSIIFVCCLILAHSFFAPKSSASVWDQLKSGANKFKDLVLQEPSVSETANKPTEDQQRLAKMQNPYIAKIWVDFNKQQMEASIQRELKKEQEARERLLAEQKAQQEAEQEKVYAHLPQDSLSSSAPLRRES